MKKVIKYFIYAIIFIGVILIGIASFIQFSDIPTYKVEMSEHLKNLSVNKDSAHVARGERIAAMLCVKCHQGTNNFLVGKKVLDMPKEFGEIYSYNITQDKEAGIGQWTDGEIIYFLKTGVRPNGTYAPPYMPKFPLMADEDIESIVSWLRSDRLNVQAAKEIQRKNTPNFMVKFLCRVAIKPLALKENIELPDTNQPIEFGKYLACGVLGCFQCHSENFKSNNELEPEKSVGYFAGGNPLLDLDGNVIVSPNITFDTQSGIGNYSEDQFLETIKTGRRPNGISTRYPMEPYSLLSNSEVKAIYAYLKTVPKIQNNN